MTQKFKVGDRVQFIGANTILSGVIKADEEDLYTVITDDAHTYFFTEDYLALAPALVAVPQWFDDAYKENANNHVTDEYAKIWFIHFIARAGTGVHFSIEDCSNPQEYCEGATNYICDHKLKLISAVLNGYTVEKEPLYRVPLTDEGRDGLLVALSYDEETDDSYEVVYVLSQVFSEENFYKLTEKQIRAYDERYWAFAVPVED